MVADHMKPLAVPYGTGFRQQRIGAMLLEPFVDVVEEVLFAPQHPGQRLPHHISRIFADTGRRDRPIELVGFAPPRVKDLRKPRAKQFLTTSCDIGQPQSDYGSRPCAYS